jgi:hypothetical protein
MPVFDTHGDLITTDLYAVASLDNPIWYTQSGERYAAEVWTGSQFGGILKVVPIDVPGGLGDSEVGIGFASYTDPT